MRRRFKQISGGPISILLFLLLGVGVASAALTFNLTRLSNPGATSGTADGLQSGGDRHNSYAWSMDVLNTGGADYLYVGSNRDLVRTVLSTMGFTDQKIETFFKGEIPVGNTDLRARIFRQKLDGTGPFEQVYVSPTLGAAQLPVDLGYRGMAVHNGDLYVVTLGHPQAYSRVLRIPAAGGAPEEVFRLRTGSLRSISTYNGQLFLGTEDGVIYAAASPVPQPPLDPSSPDSKNGWTVVAERPDLGIAAGETVGVWEFEPFDGALYASLGQGFDAATAGQGFRLYRGESGKAGQPGANAAGWLWKPIIDVGGDYPRGLGNTNNAAVSLEAFGDRLYLGTLMDVISQTGARTVFDNFTPIQIYRLDTAGKLEMVIGDTNASFPTKVGNYRAGFYEVSPAQAALPPPLNQRNLGLNAYLWWMESTGDQLFVSTFDVRTFLRYLTPENLTTLGIPPADQPQIQTLVDAIEKYNTNPPGFDLFATEDGVNFTPVTQNGFNDQFNYGGRTILNTSMGVKVGTANPFYGAQVYALKEKATPPPPPGPAPEVRNGSSCFIATAAFGTPLAPQIDTLRDFRDEQLLTNAPGRAFVRWYYANGPVWAAYIDAHPGLKPVVRGALYPLIGFAWLVNHGGGPGLLAALVLGLVWLRRKRLKAARVRMASAGKPRAAFG